MFGVNTLASLADNYYSREMEDDSSANLEAKKDPSGIAQAANLVAVHHRRLERVRTVVDDGKGKFYVIEMAHLGGRHGIGVVAGLFPQGGYTNQRLIEAKSGIFDYIMRIWDDDGITSMGFNSVYNPQGDFKFDGLFNDEFFPLDAAGMRMTHSLSGVAGSGRDGPEQRIEMQFYSSDRKRSGEKPPEGLNEIPVISVSSRTEEPGYLVSRIMQAAGVRVDDPKKNWVGIKRSPFSMMDVLMDVAGLVKWSYHQFDEYRS